MFSTTYTAVLVMVLAQVLPKIGVNVGNDELTTTVSVLASVVAGVWVLVQRYKAGGINVFGKRL